MLRLVARPRADGSDIIVLRQLAKSRWRRTPGGVRVTADESLERADGLRRVEIDDPRIAAAFSCLEKWAPAPAAVCLLDTITPLETIGTWGHGCTSGHVHPAEADGRIGVVVTIDDPIGAADGILHELAHQRLHVMGIDLERHDGALLIGDQNEKMLHVHHDPPVNGVGDEHWFYGSHLYFSPIRREVPRPMTALLHGVYAWTFMLENEIANAAPEYLSVNVPKVRMGLQTIRRYAKWTPAGESWMKDFSDWADAAVSAGENILRANGTKEIDVPRPEETRHALA